MYQRMEDKVQKECRWSEADQEKSHIVEGPQKCSYIYNPQNLRINVDALYYKFMKFINSFI